MTWPRRPALLMLCLCALGGVECIRGQQSTAAQETGSKIWVGRYQEIEEYLRTAECLDVEKLPATSITSRCVFRPGGPVARMAWMPLPPGIYRGFFTSYKTQIAAYELDKLLKMDMVAPTVERQVQGVTGAATLWVENLVGYGNGEAPPGEANRIAWDKQVARMTMFDALIGNRNRNINPNVLRDGAGNLILIDHTRAFGLTTEISPQLNRIEKDFWDRVLGLTRKDLDSKLGTWLDEKQIAAILERRERMKVAIDGLIAEKGAAAVVLR
jgi:hypothetical protein